ncbi:MAG: VanZ family protein, partial [Clostridia bacterium]|nr:VanZ family protein [Clostridia bacterium]
MPIYIYGKNINNLAICAAIACIFWFVLIFLWDVKKWLKITCCILFFVSFFGILFYTVLGRTPSGVHEFKFISFYPGEFFREMFMNALLYLPLGLALSVIIGLWAIPAAFLLSISIETWQYFAGTGLAQGTDVLMNTLGCAIGCLPVILVFVIRKVQKMFKKKKEVTEPAAPQEKPTPAFLRE